MRIKLLVISLFSLALLFFPTPAYAATNFRTDYRVNYTVLQDGNTKAQLNVTLTNTTSDYYASQYKMQVGFDNISNVYASDPQGAIKTVVTKVEDGYTVDLPFNKKSVGLGSKLNFTLSFITPSIAKKYGKVWEINIPGLSDPEDFNSFVVDVSVPPSFGTPSYTKPYLTGKKLHFTQDQLGKSGISIAFGDNQLFSYHLVYHLNNSNVFPIKTEIALPPSTNYQDVYITSINPKPSNVLQDKDGNWLAQYTLLPSQKMDILVDGKAKINLYPKPQELTEAERIEYTSDKQYWEAKSDPIREKADELRTPEAIYNYVVKSLKYDFSRVTEEKPRLGGLGALKNPKSAVCREYTDLFIAIARSAGIPAREVDGFAYAENEKQRPIALVQDILHAWPEYYDDNKKTWIMVDPTWGNTTGGVDYFNVLDVDHFTFAIKGYDSSYPVTAGGYKFPGNKTTKDVTVTFTDSVPEEMQNIDIATNIPKSVIAGFPVTGKVTLTNRSFMYIPAQILYLTSTGLTPPDQTFSAQGLPPYGSVDIPIGFHRTSFLTNTLSGFTIRLAESTFSQNIKITPVFMTIWGLGGIGIGIFTIFLFIIARKRRRI